MTAAGSFDDLLADLDRLLTAKATATRLDATASASRKQSDIDAWEKAEEKSHDMRNDFVDKLRRAYYSRYNKI